MDRPFTVLGGDGGVTVTPAPTLKQRFGYAVQRFPRMVSDVAYAHGSAFSQPK
jgi:hypothetical protein